MNILVISHMYPSSVNQTYGIFVHEQLKALVEQGCRVKVMAPVPATPFPLPLLKAKWRDYSRIPSKDRIEGIEVCYPRYLESPGSYMLEHSGRRMYMGLAKLVKSLRADFKFDLIHAHVALPDGQAGIMLKREYRVPLVVTIHGQDFQTTIKRSPKVKESLFAVLKEADQVITVSSKLKNIVQEEDFYRKITVINNGIDSSLIPLSLNSKTASSSERDSVRRVLSVSNLKKTKGIDLNLRAMAELISKYPNLHYNIAGDGEERENLEKLVQELKVENNVSFLGKLAHEEVMAQMSKADIFCLPSWQEGFGVVYIEAMAHGVPVIGVKGEGIEDAIRDRENGLLVEPKSVAEVVSALDYLISNPDQAKAMGEKGYETVTSLFTWAQNARKTLELYKEMTPSS